MNKILLIRKADLIKKGTAKLAACFDACEVTEIKIYDKTPEESVIKGNWIKGTASELTLETGNQDYWL